MELEHGLDGYDTSEKLNFRRWEERSSTVKPIVSNHKIRHYRIVICIVLCICNGVLVLFDILRRGGGDSSESRSLPRV